MPVFRSSRVIDALGEGFGLWLVSSCDGFGCWGGCGTVPLTVIRRGGLCVIQNAGITENAHVDGRRGGEEIRALGQRIGALVDEQSGGNGSIDGSIESK